MSIKVSGPALAGALWLGMAAGSPSAAQTLDQVSGPANPPPASFKGQQFIDSRGCVFVRAGFGGVVNWVPRVDARHRPICNMGAAAGNVAEAAPAGQPQAGTGIVAMLFAAPPPAPAPAAVPVADVAVTFSNPAPRVLPKPPAGWVYAWKDGRLNPMRGVGTPAGQAAQDQKWTKAVPMVLIADLPSQKQPRPAARVAVSTMSAPATAGAAVGEAAAGVMIQVGSFGQPGNATAAAGKIAGLGLPVATARAKGLQVVMAGPFGSAAEAQAGLRALRAAGFADAFLR